MESLVQHLVESTEDVALEALNQHLDLLDEDITLDCSTITNHCVCAANFEYFRKSAHVIQCLKKQKCFHCQRYRCMDKKHDTVTAVTKLLLIAAALGKFETFKFLHHNGCSLETKSGIFELRPLHIAIANGHFNIFCYLLAQQVDVNAIILSHGTTYSPLMLAVMYTQDDMVRHLLMTRDVNLTYRNSLLQSPVLFAVQNNSLELINLLLGAEEAVMNHPLRLRGNSLRRHHPCAMLEAIKQDNASVLKTLLENGESANHVFQGYSNQTTAVILAAVKNSHQCLQLLIEHGADTEADVDDFTALTWATHLGWVESTDILNTVTPKYCCSRYENCRKRKLEDNCRCSPESVATEETYSDGKLSNAMEQSEHDTFSQSDLCNKHVKGVEANPIIAIWSLVQWLDVSESIRRLVSRGYDVNTQDTLGRTALHLAVDEQNVPAVRSLLELGAFTNVPDIGLATPFWHAVFWNKESMIKELMFANVVMECEAKEYACKIGLPWVYFDNPTGPNEGVNTNDSTLRSTIYFAVKKNFFKTVKLLMETGYAIKNDNIDELISVAKPETRELLLQHVNQPQPLFNIARNYVRRKCGKRLHTLTETIDLPGRIKDCLLLRDIIDLKIEPALVHL